MGCPVVGLMFVNPVVSPSGFDGLRGRMLSGTTERSWRQIGLLGDKDDFQRVHPDGFLPAPLVGLGGFDRPVPADPVDNLRIVQVDVDRMGVHAIMGDLPNLNLASGEDLCGRIDVSETNPVDVAGLAVGSKVSYPSLAASRPY